MHNTINIGTNVKTWYTSTFPTDELGKELNPDATFQNIYDGLKRGQGPYGILGVVCDSVVRERVFAQLCKTLNVPYNEIYELWLNGPMVAARKSREQEPVLMSFQDLRKGDTIFIKGEPIEVGVNAHYSGDVSYDGYLLYDTSNNSWFPEDLDVTLPTRLAPYRIMVTETFTREVEIYAENEEDALEMAEELCNEGDIDLNADDFSSRRTECLGVSRENDLKLHQVFGKEDPAPQQPKPSLASQILGAQNRTSVGKSKETELTR